MTSIVCSECQCSPLYCSDEKVILPLKCKNCTQEVCCCIPLHRSQRIMPPLSLIAKIIFFFSFTKHVYAAALGIEILCIGAAEIGENIGLYSFGFNILGISLAYVIGYALAGFTTFMTILGRYEGNGVKIDGCCSVLEQQSDKGFLPNMLSTFKSFGKGIMKLPYLRKEPNIKYILKTSLIILVTAESACILTAETIGIVFYNYSMLLAVPLALLVGALTVVLIEASKKMKLTSKGCECENNGSDDKLISLR